MKAKVKTPKRAPAIRTSRKSAIKKLKAAFPDLPAGGRSSVEEPVTLDDQKSSFNQFWDTVNPLIPIEWYDWLTNVSCITPDLSEAVSNLVSLGNPGHTLQIEGSDQIVANAMERLNFQSYNLYKRGPGIDGLVNQYLADAARVGCVSSEDVLTPALDGVQRVAIVRISSIRFKYENGDYRPYQTPANSSFAHDWIPLNERTYALYNWASLGNSPYPLPPFLSCIQPVLTQHNMMGNLDFIIRKIGLLGLISLTLTPPPQNDGETADEYHDRLKDYAKRQTDIYKENMRKAILVKWSDQEFESHPITTDARGVRDLVQTNEEQLFSALASPPAMHGRMYGTTESWMAIAFSLLLSKAHIFQMLAKRRIEQTYRLDLQLQGIPADNVTLSFDDSMKAQPLADAQAEQVNVQTAVSLRDAGFISNDQAAQRIGYDEAFRPDADYGSGGYGAGRILKFRFNRWSQKYSYLPDRIEIAAPAPAVLPKKKLRLFA